MVLVLCVDAGAVDVECESGEPGDDVGDDEVVEDGVDVHVLRPLMVMLPFWICARSAAISAA